MGAVRTAPRPFLTVKEVMILLGCKEDLLRGFVSLMVEDSMRIITSLMLENSFTGLTTKF